MLTLCDPGDSVVMFAPYYFNAYMSFQMTGITNILVGPSNPKTLQPEVGEICGFVFNPNVEFPTNLNDLCMISTVIYQSPEVFVGSSQEAMHLHSHA